MTKTTIRRRIQAKPTGEILETRALLTGGAGDTFALIPATITKVGGTTAVHFTINPAQFTLPRHAFTLGIDVVAAPGSTVKPFISSVKNPHGGIVPQAFHSIYDPHLLHSQVANGAGTSAVLAPIALRPHNSSSPVTYTVNVQGQANTSGDFLLGFYLPGDAGGTGVVDQSDIALVRSKLGSVSSASNYSFDADTNRDGRIAQIDLAITHQNLGVKTTVMPVITANLDPAGLADVQNRVTNNPTAHFTGMVTPGATVTYAEISHKTASVSATADAMGNYSLSVPLVAGVNTFQVSSSDSFSQTIAGQIAPVTYTPKSNAQ